MIIARGKFNAIADHDSLIDAQIEVNHKSVEENLRKLQDTYGKQHLESLSDREFYTLYKKQASIWAFLNQPTNQEIVKLSIYLNCKRYLKLDLIP